MRWLPAGQEHMPLRHHPALLPAFMMLKTRYAYRSYWKVCTVRSIGYRRRMDSALYCSSSVGVILLIRCQYDLQQKATHPCEPRKTCPIFIRVFRCNVGYSAKKCHSDEEARDGQPLGVACARHGGRSGGTSERWRRAKNPIHVSAPSPCQSHAPRSCVIITASHGLRHDFPRPYYNEWRALCIAIWLSSRPCVMPLYSTVLEIILATAADLPAVEKTTCERTCRQARSVVAVDYGSQIHISPGSVRPDLRSSLSRPADTYNWQLHRTFVLHLNQCYLR